MPLKNTTSFFATVIALSLTEQGSLGDTPTDQELREANGFMPRILDLKSSPKVLRLKASTVSIG
eukprot:CAMPEP_0184010728 /NCGR_PEP_ID=MMETSP0954-20121128/3394_1 /TAXON_ID=627963 /ORGANISM="Aplanochytrium sp, Strain PBS07" /LENGTH=63 /DNA_ID=CAMNT_0026290389 /DNA_START=480 /DNA_END=671 /DNA_ORIENTATION=-